MQKYAIMICGILLLVSNTATAAQSSMSAESQVKQLELRAANAADSNVAEYAKEGLESAATSIAAAKAALAAGREKEALLQSELAESRLNTAEAKAAEKEIMEKVAVRRSELKKAEALLERYRQGEIN